MTLYMPPLSTKKKGGEQKLRDPDSKRVFGNYEENLPAAQSHYTNTHNNVLPNRKFSPAKSRILSPARQHNPHPSQVGFLLQDCRLINEPICDVKPQVKEELMDPESNKWWKWQSPNGETAPARKTLPKYSYNSSNRDEYRKPVDPKQGQTRHGNNPNSHTSSGIVPITGLPSEKGPRLLLEHISYDHQYNSRTNPSQPIRGKKHGSFVWDCFHPVSPPKLTTGTNRTTVLSAPWASSLAQDDAGSAGVPSSSKLSPVATANITRQEEVGLGTLGSTLPPSLPAVAS